MSQPEFAKNENEEILKIKWLNTKDLQNWTFYVYWKTPEKYGFSDAYRVSIKYNCLNDSLRYI